MSRQPNAFQRLIQRVLTLGFVTALFAPWIHYIDKAILRLSYGKYAASGIVGWNIIQVTTIGAKTAQCRTLPLLGLPDGEKIALIASNFGRKHNPAWYYNLKAHPECEVAFNGRTGTYMARETTRDEYEKYWQLGVSSYAGYEEYKLRAAHRHIPVMLLEPKK